MTSPHILLVGGAGYIGTAITPSLLSNGYKVTCLDNFVMKNNFAIGGFLSNSNYRFVYGDMGNQQELALALEGVTDVVILGGLVSDLLTKKYPEQAYNINNIATMRCIDMLNNRGLSHVIFISSCSNYGVQDNGRLATEDAELKPTSLYAQSKIEIEQYILSLKGRVDYCPTILRFATAFGLSPRMRLDLTINEFVYQGLTKKELLIFNPDAWRPYCHVQDFARLIDLVVKADSDQVCFETFNAGGVINNYTKQGIVDKILEYIPDVNVKCWEHVTDPRDYRVDFSKVAQQLGFVPEYTVDDGIKEIISAVNNHIFDLAVNMPRFHNNIEI